MLTYAVLSSGSCGNSYVFYDGKVSIMIDMGISMKLAEENIEKANIPIQSLSSVFLTHLHPDHAGDSLSSFVKKYDLKVFVNRYAAKKEHKSFTRLSLEAHRVSFFTLGETKVIGDFRIFALEAFHDSLGCVGYYVTNNENKICLITDTGYFSPQMIEYCSQANIVFLESNYDDELLDAGPYPQWLKNRVRSTLGHLSNEQAKRLLAKLDEKKDRDVYLIHLSENNNTKEKAFEVSKETIFKHRSIRALSRGEFFSNSI